MRREAHTLLARRSKRIFNLLPVGLALSFLCALLLSTTIRTVEAAAGDLDPAFGTGGKVSTSFPGGLDTANDVALQSDGKIVVAGSSGSDFALTRYNTNGTLDATFGVGGRVNTDFRVGPGGLANALVIQPDGKIVLAGSGSTPATLNGAFALVRYNTNGSLDTTFDGDGRVVTFFGGDATADAIALQPDGRLVVAGTRTDSATFQSVFALARYNVNGSLDASFDGDGLVTTDIPGLTFEQAHAVAVQANGRIVVAGLGSSAFVLTRYNTDGSLDSGVAGDLTPGDSFGSAGIVTTAFGGSFEEARALAIQTDGKIVAAGATALSVASEDNFALARYNTDGTLDTSSDITPGTNFDTDGKLTTDFGLVDSANAVVIQTDGRIVAAGSAGTIAGGSFFALARYDTNGALDNSFDTDGKVLTDFSGGRFGLGAQGVALQTDGKIVAAGDSNLSANRDFGVARYDTVGTLDPSFDGDGKTVTDFPLNEESVTGMVVQTDGKIVAVGRFNGTIRILQTQDPNFMLTRYNTNGTLDTSFGSGGLVSTGFLAGGDDFANAVALQTDGKIVVVGQTGAHFSQVPSADTTFGVARYNTDGSLDNTFDGDGKVTTDFGSSHDTANAVAIQTDGKIVVAGSNGSDFALARYNSNGTLDTVGFGAGTGKVTTDFAGGFDLISGVMVQTDNKIVAAGTSGSDFGLARYNTDGTLDMANFGVGGKVTTDFSGGADTAAALVIQPDGKLVAAGSAALPAFGGGSNTDVALARYDTNGALDMAFGSGGKVTTAFEFGAGGYDSAAALALQADGKLVVAGFYWPEKSGSPLGVFALARYNTNGELDSSFGRIPFGDPSFPASGIATTDFFGINTRATAVVIQADGKIVLGGFTDTGSSNDFALARYQATTPDEIEFLQANFNAYEEYGLVTLSVRRFGNTTGPASVDFVTSDGTAIQRTDYTLNAGTIKFAPGQTIRTFNVLITEDAYVEGNESFTLTLNTPVGVAIGAQGSATVTILDSDSTVPPVVNPIDDPNIFVRQHYHDMLAREGDSGGIAYWTNEITQCGSNATCIRLRRVGVSDAFFFEPEYQNTAAYLYRIYKVSFNAFPAYTPFMRDRSRLVGGVMLDADKNAFNDAFVQRTAFLALFPLTMTPAQYVDALNANTGNALTPAQRDALVNGLAGNTETRGSVLRKVAENSVFIDQEYNNAFVVNLYFSYLRRDPEPGGFNFWLTQINSAPLRNVAKQQALVCSFITSLEYQERFSSVITRTNAECGP